MKSTARIAPAYLSGPSIVWLPYTGKTRTPGVMLKATEWTSCPGRLCESGAFRFPGRQKGRTEELF